MQQCDVMLSRDARTRTSRSFPVLSCTAFFQYTWAWSTQSVCKLKQLDTTMCSRVSQLQNLIACRTLNNSKREGLEDCFTCGDVSWERPLYNLSIWLVRATFCCDNKLRVAVFPSLQTKEACKTNLCPDLPAPPHPWGVGMQWYT